jgi:hypothetical protein
MFSNQVIWKYKICQIQQRPLKWGKVDVQIAQNLVNIVK